LSAEEQIVSDQVDQFYEQIQKKQREIIGTYKLQQADADSRESTEIESTIKTLEREVNSLYIKLEDVKRTNGYVWWHEREI
jgi:hypothetical protein